MPLISLIDPRTGESTGELAAADAESVREAVARSRFAQRDWAALPVSERAATLERIRKRFLERAEDVVAAILADTGKPEAEAWLSEIVTDNDLFLYWIKSGPGLLKRDRVGLSPVNYPGKTAFVEKVPRGVLGVIAPWNLPVAIPLRALVPALLAGNGVVLKPSEYASRCGGILGEIFSAELPDGLVGIVQGGGETGAALIGAGIHGLLFTGSVATGKTVARTAAEHLVPVSVELGGKDAAIVLADADLERAAHGIVWGGIFNCGQNCAAVERVYVEKPIAEAFTRRVAEIAGKLRLGDDVGPVINAAQRDKIAEQVRAAVAAGAKIEVGGEPGEGGGFWYPPTVLTGADEEAAVVTEETFGPVIPIHPVDDADEAIELANKSAFGLTASVWTKDVRRGEAIARRLEAGVVTVNNHGFTGGVPSLPWSGVKQSGYGVTNSPHTLDAMVRPRLLLVDRSRAKREMWWYPYNDALLDAAKALRDLGLGRMGAALRLVGAFGKRFKGADL
jgi:acyl-CoA reductase-like NAD-dependent aldehyde dehydrogenase